MKKIPYDVIKKLRHVYFGIMSFKKGKKVILRCSTLTTYFFIKKIFDMFKILYSFFGYSYPIFNDVIRNLFHGNIDKNLLEQYYKAILYNTLSDAKKECNMWKRIDTQFIYFQINWKCAYHFCVIYRNCTTNILYLWSIQTIFFILDVSLKFKMNLINTISQ